MEARTATRRLVPGWRLWALLPVVLLAVAVGAFVASGSSLVNLIGANLYKTLIQEDVSQGDFRYAFMRQANLPGTSMRGARLTGASLYMARLKRTDLTGATLIDTDLRGALLEGTRLADANISGARIYGISVWNVKTEGLEQDNLVITPL